ncbi:hypothetical protein E4U41_003152 [Claviceps citrina]|nr:hypothetical protein E4U41_003152 [Claviceps citrina]
MLPDHYKHRPIRLYDPRESRLLNHRRPIVPRVRALIDTVQFVVLVLLYAATMVVARHHHRPGGGGSRWEAAFAVYTAGWVLQEFASVTEHGWELHSQMLWSFLDLTFIVIYSAYVLVRAYLRPRRRPLPARPRPARPNIVFISLHAMMRGFTLLSFLAIWCFLGFLLSLMWLLDTARQYPPYHHHPHQGEQPAPAPAPVPAPSWQTVGKWLLWIWFGLDGTGIAESARFHVVLGPALNIAFAFLGNTLFLAILVAVLTNTFSKIVANEAAEIRFRRTVLTFEGVKSDSLFAYPPPSNIAALVVILPLKMVVSPRLFHTINVAIIRVINAPLLIAISLFERRRLWRAAGRKSGGGGGGGGGG